MTTRSQSTSGLQTHPPAYARTAMVKPAVTRKVEITVRDPYDHIAPAILHEPHVYNQQKAGSSAVILVSGAGGDVSGPSG